MENPTTETPDQPSVDSLTRDLWQRITSPDPKDIDKHPALTLCEDWNGISSFLRIAETENKSVQEKVLAFLHGKAKTCFESIASENGNRVSFTWIHLLGFLTLKWNVDSPPSSESNPKWKTISTTIKKPDPVGKFIPKKNLIELYAMLLGIGRTKTLLAVLEKISTKSGQEKERRDFWAKKAFPWISPEETFWLHETTQAMLLHLLALSMLTYSESSAPALRVKSVRILIVLIRRLFTSGDAAAAFYKHLDLPRRLDGRLGEFLESISPLYDEIVSLEELEQYAFKKNAEIESSLKKQITSQQTDSADSNEKTPGTLLSELLHGDVDLGHGHKQKRTKVSQLTFLIREAKPELVKARDVRRMVEKFGDFGLSRMNYHLDKVTWIPQEEEENKAVRKRGDTFTELIKEAFISDWPTKSLKALFRSSTTIKSTDSTNNRGGRQVVLPEVIWISDGEIIFFLLLAGLSRVYLQELSRADLQGRSRVDLQYNGRKSCEGWITGDTNNPVELTRADLLPFESENSEGQDLVELPIGPTFEHVVTDTFCLFDKANDYFPTPRFWSLFNFLERSHLEAMENEDGVPRILPKSHEHTKILTEVLLHLYRDLSEVRNHKKLYSTLTSSCLGLFNERFKHHEEFVDFLSKNKRLKAIKDVVRLPSLFIDLLLRVGEKTPRTLFFYPIMHDDLGQKQKSEGNIIPLSVLAGTYMDLENHNTPHETARLNAHVWKLVNICQPVIHFIIASQLKDDDIKLSQSLRDQLIAEERANLLPKWAHNMRTPTAALLNSIKRGSALSRNIINKLHGKDEIHKLIELDRAQLWAHHIDEACELLKQIGYLQKKPEILNEYFSTTMRMVKSGTHSKPLTISVRNVFRGAFGRIMERVQSTIEDKTTGIRRKSGIEDPPTGWAQEGSILHKETDIDRWKFLAYDPTDPPDPNDFYNRLSKNVRPEEWQFKWIEGKGSLETHPTARIPSSDIMLVISGRRYRAAFVPAFSFIAEEAIFNALTHSHPLDNGATIVRISFDAYLIGPMRGTSGLRLRVVNSAIRNLAGAKTRIPGSTGHGMLFLEQICEAFGGRIGAKFYFPNEDPPDRDLHADHYHVVDIVLPILPVPGEHCINKKLAGADP